MTYNFDPDKWYEMQKTSIEARYRSGFLSKTEFDEAMEELDRRYGDMWDKLDGTYEIPD